MTSSGRFERFDYAVWVLCVVLVALTLAVYGVGTSRGIVVAAAVENEATQVSPFARVGVTFPEAMQRPTVQAQFSITPQVLGTFRWQGSTLWFIPDQPYVSGQDYEVVLSPGAAAESGRRVRAEFSFVFSVREPMILYRSVEDGSSELWKTDLTGEAAEQLTGTKGLVFDFGVSRDGDHIAFSVINEDRGIDLWFMNRDGSGQTLLLACGLDRCSGPAWSHDGRRIAYTREGAGLNPGEPLGPPRIWILDVETGETVRLFANTQKLGFGALWSPDGERLALVDSAAGAIRIVEFGSGDEVLLPTQLGAVGAWSPDGEAMIFSDISMDGDRPFVQIYLAELQQPDISTVKGVLSDPEFDYSVPAWSPDGEWMVVGMRRVDSAFGRQLWLMPLDAAFAEHISDAPEYVHYNYVWDLYGTGLLYQRTLLATGETSSEIVVWSRETYETRVVANNGAAPAWLP